MKSLKSLLDSCKLVKNKIDIDIVDDSSGEDFLKRLDSILKRSKFNYKIHKISGKNNGKSLYKKKKPRQSYNFRF